MKRLRCQTIIPCVQSSGGTGIRIVLRLQTVTEAGTGSMDGMAGGATEPGAPEVPAPSRNWQRVVAGALEPFTDRDIAGELHTAESAMWGLSCPLMLTDAVEAVDSNSVSVASGSDIRKNPG